MKNQLSNLLIQITSQISSRLGSPHLEAIARRHNEELLGKVSDLGELLSLVPDGTSPGFIDDIAEAVQNSEGNPDWLLTLDERQSRVINWLLRMNASAGTIASKVQEMIVDGRATERSEVEELVGSLVSSVAIVCDFLGLSVEDCVATHLERRRARV